MPKAQLQYDATGFQSERLVGRHSLQSGQAPRFFAVITLSCFAISSQSALDKNDTKFSELTHQFVKNYRGRLQFIFLGRTGAADKKASF